MIRKKYVKTFIYCKDINTIVKLQDLSLDEVYKTTAYKMYTLLNMPANIQIILGDDNDLNDFIDTLEEKPIIKTLIYIESEVKND